MTALALALATLSTILVTALVTAVALLGPAATATALSARLLICNCAGFKHGLTAGLCAIARRRRRRRRNSTVGSSRGTSMSSRGSSRVTAGGVGSGTHVLVSFLS